jgi:NAD(P)-dependent dehydrogenase (short-subunit alcohol dehydrogenase family)
VADFRAQVDVNLNSAFIVTKAFLAEMVSRGSGMFFLMASVAAFRAYPAGVAYGASKHGLLGLARALREETRERGIRVTTVMPGATWTPSWHGAGHPEGRMMPVADIAALVLSAWRLSDRSVVEEIVVRPQLGDI